MGSPSKAEMLTEVWQEVIQLFFKLQAIGRDVGAVNASNGSTWGVLHTLMTHGATTVPEIARMRPVSRQHIQMLANELAAGGLVEFVHNPRHRRSKLVSITERGRATYLEQSNAMTDVAREMVEDFSKDDLETTVRVLNALKDRLQDKGSETEVPEPVSHRQRRRRTGLHAAIHHRHRDK